MTVEELAKSLGNTVILNRACSGGKCGNKLHMLALNSYRFIVFKKGEMKNEFSNFQRPFKR